MRSIQKLVPVFGLACWLATISPTAGQEQDTQVLSKSQETTRYWIDTRNGWSVFGQISSPDEDPVVIVTEYGILKIPRQDIKTIKKIRPESVKQGKYWFPNPNQSRLFFAPTGRMLEKKEGYFADYYLFFPSAAFALSDRFTLSGGCSIFPGAGLDEQIFYLAPKFGLVEKEKFNMALGALLVRLPNWDEDESLPTIGLLYGVSTFGKPDANVTLGLGYGFADDHATDKPAVVLGGEKRISRRISLVTENWVIPEMDPLLLSYGIRFMGEKMVVDFAFITITGKEGLFPGVPFVDFVFNF